MPQLFDKMTRKEIYRKHKFIACSSCNTMRPSGDFYVMFKLGGAYEALFQNEIYYDNQWATCDDCCGDKFAERVKKYINKEV